MVRMCDTIDTHRRFDPKQQCIPDGGQTHYSNRASNRSYCTPLAAITLTDSDKDLM